MIVLRTAYFFAEKEIGRRKISFSELRRRSGQWELMSPQGELTGVVSLSFEVDKRWLSMDGLHTSTCSWGDLSPSRPCLSDRSYHTRSAVGHELEQIRLGLSQENVRLHSQELSLEAWLLKLQHKAQAVQGLRQALHKRKNAVAEHARSVAEERAQLQAERLRVAHEWEEIRREQTELEQQFTRLRLEKLKTQTHHKL